MYRSNISKKKTLTFYIRKILKCGIIQFIEEKIINRRVENADKNGY